MNKQDESNATWISKARAYLLSLVKDSRTHTDNHTLCAGCYWVENGKHSTNCVLADLLDLPRKTE